MKHITRMISSLAVLSLIFSTMSFAEIKDTNKYDKIMYTNDLHGDLNKIKNINKDSDTIWIDGGDILHGDDLALFSQGDIIIDLLNLNKLDILIPGNHDFDYGSDRLLELDKKLNAEIIVANVYNKENERLFKPYTVKEIGNKQILIIGLTTEEINTKIYKPMIEKIKVTNPVEEYKKVLKEIKNLKYDEILVVTHVGSKIVANNFKESILILDGHDHFHKKTETYRNNGFQTNKYDLIDSNFKPVEKIIQEQKNLTKHNELINKYRFSQPKIPTMTKTINLKEKRNLDSLSEELNIDWRVLFVLNKDKNLSQKYQFVKDSITIPIK